jgi:hypothetical protein
MDSDRFFGLLVVCFNSRNNEKTAIEKRKKKQFDKKKSVQKSKFPYYMIIIAI